jgi:hypothetical protein
MKGLGFVVLVLAGCGAVQKPPAAARCSGEGEGEVVAANATHRAQAVLFLLRGCDRAAVARRYHVAPETLESWTHRFVAGGRSNLIAPGEARPADLQAAMRGTWVLRSRIAHGNLLAQVDGIMIFEDDQSLTLESGVLSDAFAELPLGPQANQSFRLGQFSHLSYLQRQGSPYVVRMSASELVGSYSDYPRGIRASLVEPFLRRGDAYVHHPAPTRSYSPSSSDEMVLMGDTLLIAWSKLDVVDTWERVRKETPPLLGDARSLSEAWQRLKKSGTLLEKTSARTTELLGISEALASAPPAR